MVKRLLPFLFAVSVPLFFTAPAMAGFGPESLKVEAINQNGSPDIQAGSHPYALETSFTLVTPAPGSPEPEASPKNISVELPPGFVGDPHATARCTYIEFSEKRCPPNTQVGESITYLVETRGGENPIQLPTEPIYNIEPSPGIAAEFAYRILNIIPIHLGVAVRTGGDYGLTVTSPNTTEVDALYGTKITIWGVPCEVTGCMPHLPLLTNPTSCGVPRTATIRMNSWEHPTEEASLSSPMPELKGCEKLDFSPSIAVTPDGTAGSTPTGLNVTEHIPQDATQNPAGLAEADVKNTTVALPAGVQVSPSAADGLLACSPAQIGLHNNELPACPDASKVGTVEIDTPLLSEPLTGSVYLATQEENPFGSLLALYIYAESPTYGVRVKVAGQVTLDPVTGQLVTTFKETPPLPYSDLKLAFFGSARAPLTTPAFCGAYTTETTIEPWTGTSAVHPSSKFQVTSGPNGAPCASPLPFAPSLTAGTTSIQAGGFSPFTMTMSREDGNQNLDSIKLHMPPGLLGTLSTVKLCGEAQGNAGTCGPESLIGHTIISVGLGGDPFSVSGGQVFITGPYEGAPYGLSIVNPAKAGPFDLGKVVVRAKVEVDQTTAALTITTDNSGPYRIPTILDGIPLEIKHVNVSIDRPNFTFNPTNCNPLAITGSLTSSEGSTDALSVPLQVTNCAVLAFKPKLTAKTSGKTSRANGASLSVKLTYPAGPYDANIARVKVDLPKQLPSRLTTLQKACLAATFESNPANCPAASIVGHATATTPVLPVPLTGPAYFVSHGGEAFPDLIIVLQGYGTTVDLVGTTFINKAGITSSTFKTIPDVPVGTFEMTLPQGKYSALAANGNLCKSKLAMPTAFVGQNGAVIHTSTPITATGCPKAKKKKAKSKTKKKK
jgi:hypothetical protein